MTIKEMIQRHRRKKAAQKAIRNVYDSMKEIADELVISLSDAIEEAKQSVGCDQKDDE